MININYKLIRKLSPEAARVAVLQYLSSNGHNISDCARVFNIQRVTVYDILKKSQQSDLKDRSKAPKTPANKTPWHLEQKILATKIKTGFGPRKISKYLAKKGIKISFSTIKGILRRKQQHF